MNDREREDDRARVRGAALFSPDGRYRYVLERVWKERPAAGHLLFIGLNPSTADAERDDPTIRRIMRFARDWGYGGAIVCNLFALRTTDPRGLKRVADPVGPQNDRFLRREARRAAAIVVCWGNHGRLRARATATLRLLNRSPRPLLCFGLTRHGQPRHPLYLRRDVAPLEFTTFAPPSIAD